MTQEEGEVSSAVVDAVLPAGGRISGPFAAEAGAEVKALIPLGRGTVLEGTIRALRESAGVGRVVVIGPAELSGHPAVRGAEAVLPEGESGPENIFRGLHWLYQANGGRHAERVLVMTTDLPFLTAETLTRYLEACPANADLCVPLVRRQEFEQRFRGAEVRYVKLRDGEWTMGCAFLVRPEALVASRHHVERAYAARKSQWAMARLLGMGFTLRFLVRRLGVSDIERRCQGMLGCVGAAIRGSPPELAFDIDRPEDYRYALRHLGGR